MIFKGFGGYFERKTKSIWHPFKSHWGGESGKKRWVDES